MKAVLALYVLLAAASAVLAADETVRAARVEEARVVDGVINDGKYPSEPATGFREYRPNLGEPAEDETEVYIVYDDVALYVGWVCYEDNVRGLVANAMVRDSPLNPDDCVGLMLDANNDRQTAYDFMVNCLG